MSKGSKATKKANRYLEAYGRAVDISIKKKLKKMPYRNENSEAYVLGSMIEELKEE